jgi:hypothetical protein
MENRITNHPKYFQFMSRAAIMSFMPFLATILPERISKMERGRYYRDRFVAISEVFQSVSISSMFYTCVFRTKFWRQKISKFRTKITCKTLMKLTAECVTDLDYRSEIIILKTILCTFKSRVIFEADMAVVKNGLRLKTNHIKQI